MGPGSRIPAFRRVLADTPGLTCVGLVLRRDRASSVPVYTDLGRCLDQTRPDFVLCLVQAHITPAVLSTAIEYGTPVLALAPPAAGKWQLERLSDLVDSGLVQIAEYHPLLPEHAARLKAVHLGMIGEVTAVQISTIPAHNAMALIRAYLSLDAPIHGCYAAPWRHAGSSGVAPQIGAVARPHRFITSSNDDPQIRRTTTILTSVEFGQGLSGLYSSASDHQHDLLKSLLSVRGTLGEISGDQIVRLGEHHLITTTHLHRHPDQPQSSLDPDAPIHGCCATPAIGASGLDVTRTTDIALGDQILWTNPHPEMAWNDEEVAIAEFLSRMTSWVRGDGPAPYPLSQALFDARLGVAVHECVEQNRAIEVTA